MPSSFSNLVLKRCLAVIDLETTGLSPKLDHIVELAVVKLRPDGSRQKLVRRINPNMQIPEAASAIHGISDRDVVTCPKFEAIAARLNGFLKNCDLCGFNIKHFDLPFLIAAFQRAEIRFSLVNRAIIDVQQIFKRQERRDLSAAVRRYLNREHTNAHGALSDAHAAAAVLNAQLHCHSDLPRTAEELHSFFTEVDFAGPVLGGRELN